ncbi:transcriptional regulator FtrA [Methylobacterium tarhaniae]|uniref:transcriptional regulator FtrA n=1 Tax=Methylobacterium tarhaniae TaxID=1187852 RepID=UPI0009F93895|nr:transcriptional regulator FtrA [Methylobacterium tarhaniae]
MNSTSNCRVNRKESATSKTPLVVAMAYDGLCLFEFGIAVELFGLERPEMGENWYRFVIASVEPSPLRATSGVEVSVQGGVEFIDAADIVVVPGWRSATALVPEAMCAALCRARARGSRIVSFCSGVFVLAAAGLLTGRAATTHWRYISDLARRYPEIDVQNNVLYVDDGDILTAAGSAAGIDLALHMIRCDFGAEAAAVVARRLVVPAHREGDQVQIIARPVAPENGRSIARLLDEIRADLRRSYTIAGLAKRFHMCERNFLRRFKQVTGLSPAQWITRERIQTAQDMLRNSDYAIDDIAMLCGFGNAALMRHHFRLQLDATPRAFRVPQDRDPVPSLEPPDGTRHSAN